MVQRKGFHIVETFSYFYVHLGDPNEIIPAKSHVHLGDFHSEATYIWETICRATY